MHELGIVEEIVQVSLKHANGARVRRVVVEVGSLVAVLPDAMRFCFSVAAEGTAIEGAQLDIVEVPGDALNVKQLEVA